MKKITACVLLILLCPFFSFGQGETSNWYFGKGAGIQFNNDGTVTPVQKSNIDTFEGCASISDPFGNLLFYTDGISVYDRRHETMKNGKDLYGDRSSSQSAIIVPKPDDSSIYYIFTVDTSTFEDDPNFGLNYSVVDITLNNGYGEITQKNINLLASCSEKITAVIKDCFEKSIWVVTLAAANGRDSAFNTFYSYEINTQGVNLTPVKSTINNFTVQDPRGYMKVSADGSTVAVANATDGLFLFDFDNINGRVSNPLEIPLDGLNFIPYGVEFSPNNEFLYVHASNERQQNGPLTSSLLQYEVNSPDIKGSEVVIDERGIFRGALQQAENGKIYRTISQTYLTGSEYLGVIHNPNEKGLAANYEHDAVYLNGQIATQGLPPFIQSFFSNTGLVRNTDDTTSSTLTLCSGDALVLEAENIPGATYIWEKDGLPLNVPGGNIYSTNNVSVNDGGRYRVEILSPDPFECPIIGQSQIKVIPNPDPSLTLTQCDVDATDTTDGLTTINLAEINTNPDYTFYFYESVADRAAEIPIDNTTQYQNSIPFSQTLYYKVVNTLGCTSLGEVDIQVNPVTIETSPYGPYYSCDLNPDDGDDTNLFDLSLIASNYGNTEVKFYESLEDLALEINPLPGNYSSGTKTIYARLESGSQCVGVQEVPLYVLQSPTPEIQESFSLCTDGEGLQLRAPSGFDAYRWYRSGNSGLEEVSAEQRTIIREAGTYFLEAGYNYNIDGEVISCSNSIAFNVLPSNRALIENLTIKDFSTNNSLQIEVSGDGIYEYSVNGTDYQESNYFDKLEPGFLTVYVRDINGCGITEKEVAILGYPKFFTPNGDGVNDYWQITGINGEFGADAQIAIYDRYGTFIAQISPNEQGWNGNANTGALPASDYWFSVILKNGREFKGHFALKR